MTGKSPHTNCVLISTQTQPMAYQAKRHQPNNHRGYLPMENAIARKLDPPEINPVEIESVLLNRLASVGQKSYAEHMGISESTVSRRKAEGYFCNMAKELAFLGIQAAPPEAVLVSRNYLTAVEILADAGLKAERARPDALGWD
ncbi:Gifsy-1 prophage cI protein [Salmonella enterica subsp. enterica serovar Choleraesuis str. SCSA50]|uniref:Gifsy-1 prophage cI protein n=68 Tax=Salmonella TaxID=590 RepID=Q57L73_SALCH|nr:Gifsy-1 prophage cI protein [Salmonella enterica subsp. enterica serovar Choleraesuis str. SC-B67]EFZ07262.1 Gifsy-1 prophage cI protein [Salmonella enterica subsp. enterica serovar Choleraesuis str. SCSA50]